MPAFGAVQIQSRSRRAATVPIVSSISGGGHWLLAHCTKIVDSRGIMPSRAIIEIRNHTQHRETFPNGAVLATDAPFSEQFLKYYSRIRVEAEGRTLFVGGLIRRRDIGNQNTLVLEYWDDRWLLSKLPVRGAWVYDAYAGEAKFIPGYIWRMNPFGYRNCTLAPADGAPWAVPCFTQLAERGTGAGGDGEAEVTGGAPGVAIPWTKEFALKALWYLATKSAGAYYPEQKLLDTNKLAWRGESLNFIDADMRHAMPDTTLHGRSMLRALAEVFEQSGAYDWTTEPEGDKSVFAVCGRTPTTGDKKDIDLQTSGANTDLRTAYDFTREIDASEVCTSVLVEGSRPKIEAEFIYVPGSATNTIRPAWTAEEWTDFRAIIIGDGTYATILQRKGDFGGGRIVCDGVDGRPWATDLSTEAVKLAFQQYPNVLRAWQIVSDPGDSGFTDIETMLKGADNRFANAPFLFTPRPPLPEQLQHHFESAADQRGLIQLPIRVQVNLGGDSEIWHEVTSNSGLRIRSDGIIIFDGLVGVIANPDANDVLHPFALDGNENLPEDPEDPEGDNPLRGIKINMALQHDTRVKAAADLVDTADDYNEIYDFLDESVLDVAGQKGLQHYVFAPESYREWHQVGSKPTGSEDYPSPDGGGSDPAPLTRILRSETAQALAHAKSRLKDKSRLQGCETWSLIGIRSDFKSGDFIYEAVLIGSGGAIHVGRPVRFVEHDFVAQATHVVTGK